MSKAKQMELHESYQMILLDVDSLFDNIPLRDTTLFFFDVFILIQKSVQT